MPNLVKQRDAKLSKELILKNAIELFSKKEFSNASMEELAKMCNLNKAMIFYYFKNKQGLYEAVIIFVLDEIYNAIMQKNQTIKQPTHKLKSFIETFTLFAWQKPYLSSLLLRELSNNSSISQTLFSNMKKLYALFCTILEDGKDIDFKKDSVNNSMMLYFMITGTINLMITTKNIRKEAHHMDKLNTSYDYEAQDISSYLINQILTNIQKENL